MCHPLGEGIFSYQFSKLAVFSFETNLQIFRQNTCKLHIFSKLYL